MSNFLKVNIQNLFMNDFLPLKYFISSLSNLPLFNFIHTLIESIQKTNSAIYILITNNFIIFIIYLFQLKSTIFWTIIFRNMVLKTVVFTLNFNYWAIYLNVNFSKFVLFYKFCDFFKIQKCFLANQPKLYFLIF